MKHFSKAGISIFLLLIFVAATYSFAGDLGLVETLSRQLGVTSDQAEGGAGAIFKTAKQNLSQQEYTQVSDAVPEARTLLDKAPEAGASGGLSGSIGGAASALGGGKTGLGSAAEKMGGIGALADSFEALGLDSSMVGKFMPVVLDYAKEKGGVEVMNLLKGALM